MGELRSEWPSPWHHPPRVLDNSYVARESHNVAATHTVRGVDPTVVDENCRTLLTERRSPCRQRRRSKIIRYPMRSAWQLLLRDFRANEL